MPGLPVHPCDGDPEPQDCFRVGGKCRLFPEAWKRESGDLHINGKIQKQRASLVCIYIGGRRGWIGFNGERETENGKQKRESSSISFLLSTTSNQEPASLTTTLASNQAFLAAWRGVFCL
jgi:hypothetical protein